MLLNILKDSLNLMKKNLNLTQLVFIFFIIMTLVMPILVTMKLNFKAIPFIVIFFVLLCAIFAGLFYSFKKAVDYETEPPEKDNPFDLSPLYFSEFLQGTGFYLKKFVLAGLLFLIIFLAFAFGYDYFVHHFVVIPSKLVAINMNEMLANESKMLEFVNSLSSAEQIKIGKISMLTIGVISLFAYITMLYPVILVSKEENFFKSFITSLKYLFKNLPLSVLIFLFFNICLGCASLLNASVSNSIVVSIIAILLQCYLNVWYILTLFVYYEEVK